MKFSLLTPTASVRTITRNFAGYNHNIQTGDGEFYDMKNLSSLNFPILTQREKRGLYECPQGTEEEKAYGIIGKDSLVYIGDNHVYINNYRVPGIEVTEGEKQLISMGAYLIIMPDKKYVNTADLSDVGNIEASFTTSTEVTFTMCKIDGEELKGTTTMGETAPSNPANNDYWIDTSQKPHTLKQYNEASSMWTSIATTYIKISAPGIADSFKQYDAVTIRGIKADNGTLQDLEGKTSVIWETSKEGASESFIVVIGFLDSVVTQSDPITLERKMPLMDFVIESQNRLWGCRYGMNAEGKVVNEIYASKLGDFKNWNCYMGLANDSYAATVGTDGQFTGAITHLGYPIFFKENNMHKVYGNFPSNYQVQNTPCRGVVKGAGKSLAIVNEALYYKSRNGVCVYDGSLPREISSPLGNIRYSETDTSIADPLRNGAVAGSISNRYYISMKSEEDGTWNLFVYDTKLGIWMKEDDLRPDAFAECRGELYYIDHYTKKIGTILGSGKKSEEDIEWMAESGHIGTDMPDRKYVTSLQVRMSMAVGSRAMFYIQYDGMGDWKHLNTLVGTNLRSFTMPVRPRRCDYFKIRIVGRGTVNLHSIVKTIEEGSDRW